MPPVVSIFARGETIFREGDAGQHAYIVKVGLVEISILRGGQKIILTKIEPGKCFGEIAVILGEERSATAIAHEHTELYVVNRTLLDQLMQQANPLLRTILIALIERVKRLTAMTAPQAVASNVLVSFATTLELLARSSGSGRSQSEVSVTNLPYYQCLETLTAINSSMPPFRVKEIFRRMVDLNLIRIDGVGKLGIVRFEPSKIVAKACEINAKMKGLGNDQLHSDMEFIELAELARLVETEESVIIRKMAQGGFPSDLFLFRRPDVIRLLKDRGRQFFTKRAAKKIEDLGEFCDIEFVNQETLALAFRELDPCNLALVLKKQDKSVRERALDALSPHLRESIIQIMDTISEVDEALGVQLEQHIIERIKQIALG